MPLTPLRTLDRLASTFRADLNALFEGELQAWSLELDALAASIGAFAAGTAIAIPYTFSSTTTDADPGAGKLRLDNFAAQTSATTMRVDLFGADGVDRTARLATFVASTSTVTGNWRLVDLDDPLNWLEGEFTAMASPSGYRNFTLSNVTGSAAAPFANDANLVLMFTRTGDKGSTGAAGSSKLTYTARSSDTQLTAANFASSTRVAIDATSTFTQTIVAASTITAGDYVEYQNSGTGIITIDPNTTDTINGAATLKIFPGESCRITCDGVSAFQAIGLAGKGSHIELSRTNAAGLSSVDLTSLPTSDFDELWIQGYNCKPATDNTALYMRTSTDNGVTWDSGANNYATSQGTASGSQADHIELTDTGVGNDTGESCSFTIRLIKPGASAYCYMYWNGTLLDSSATLQNQSGSAVRRTSSDVDAVSIYFPAVNFTSGTIVLTGVKK